MDILPLVFWFVLGTIIGSFLNVVIWRLPRQESLGGRSKCPRCGHTLSWWELFPLFSFLFLRGRCRKCKKSISSRYILIEGIAGILFALAWFILQPHLAAGYLSLVKFLLVISVFIVVFVVDLEHYIILDNVILPAGVAVLALSAASDLAAGTGLLHLTSQFLLGIIGACLAALPLFLIWYFSKGRWMGFGDVKLAAFLGAALGWPLVYVDILMAIFLGGIAAVFLLASRKKTLKSQVPFGTFLSVAGLLALFWGDKILHWYLALLGY